MEKETFSQRAWEKDYDRDIKETYGKIKELLKKSPWAEEVLTTLVELEDVVDQKLFATLNAKYGESRWESTVKQGFDSSPKWRNYLESKTLESVVGEKTTTDQLLAVFAKKFDEIIKNKSLSPEEKLKELGIKYIKTEKMILPPDPEYRRIQTGSGKWWKEQWPDYDRIGRLVWLLKDIGVYTTDYTVIVWTNTENAMRRESYVMFQIPKLNKTILVNNCYGEATFIYDGILEYDDVVAYSKKDLSSQLTKIIFSHSKKEAWDVQILGELTRIEQEVKEKREKGELSEPKSVKEIFKANREAISNEKKREEITKFFLKNYGTKIEITKENEKDYIFPEEESNGLNIFTGEKNEQLYIFTEGKERNVYTFTEEDKEKLIMMSHEERSDLKITVWGEAQGLKATARTFWLKEGAPRGNQKDREKLLSEIIWEKIKSKEEIFKTKFIERLESKLGKNIESFTDEDKEKLVMMTGEERNKAFEITVWGESQSLNKIATAYWVEGRPATNQKDREKLLSEAIWEKIKSKEEITDALNEEIRKETIKYFNEHYATKMIENWKEVYVFTEEDKEKLVMMSQEERKKLKITVWGEAQGLQAAATAFWLREEDPPRHQEDREKLLSEIIKGGIKSKKEIFKTKFIERLENKFGKNIESFTDEDKEKLVIMTIEERNKAFEITVWGEPQSLDKIATACWVEGLPANNQKDREKFLSEIIKGGIKSKEEIFKAKFIECLENKLGKNIESFTDEDLEKLVMMSQEERNKAFEIIVWGESQSLNKIATACWRRKENPTRKQEDREKLLSEIIWAKIKSKKELIKKYFTKVFSTDEEAKEMLVIMTELGRSDCKISIQGRKLGLKGMAKDFWVKGDPVKDLEVLEKLIDTIWTYEPPKEKSLSSAKDSLQAHHCELNEETLLEEVNSTNTDEGAKVLQ